MTERKFSKNLGRPGMAAQLRETVSQVVRESSSYSKATLTEPIDFEAFVLKNKTLLQNDPQRELLLYPPDDISQVVLPRRYRTVCHSVPQHINLKECSLFTRECIKTYTCNWHLIHYKYSAYSGSYLDLPKVSKSDELKDEVYEVDTDVDQVDEDPLTKGSGVTKQGFLLKGPDGGSDRMFVNLGHKSFKRRYCYLRREVDGTYILELHKDDKKGEAKATIVMDFCTEVIRNSKKGRYCFELRMSGTQKSCCLAAESETDLQDWISKLTLIISQNKVQEERRSSSLERDLRKAISPPQSPCPVLYGTLKGLEQSVNPQLMKYARETESSIALARREHRKRLFSIYPFMSNSKGLSAPSPCSSTYLTDSAQEPYKEQFGVRVLVKCEEIKFRLQAPVSEDAGSAECTQVEPYFTTLALFDAKEGRKISEDFHFNVNSPEMQKLMEDICCPDGEDEKGGGENSHADTNGHVTPDTNCDSNHSNQSDSSPPRKWVFQCKQAVMSVMRPHSDIYLVLRIDKMLQGNVIQVAEPYIRSAKDPKLALKTYKSFRATCQRIRKYRMPFAWSARPLFRVYSNELDTASEFPALYRQDSARLKDEEILKILADYRKPDRLNKLTVIPGRATITVSPYNTTSPPLDNSLTSDHLPLKPFASPPTSPPTLEVAPLHSPETPHTVYQNTLYVYPESLAFESQKTFTRARNIACVVQLRDGDQENARPLKNIYSRFGSLSRSACCAVLHHSPSPSWYDEVKIRLPHRLSPSHHLLFIFRHISIEGAKKKEGGAETGVGYAWVPLISKGRLNLDKQCLPVASALPPGYLSVQPLGLGKGYAGPDIVWVDAQRPLFCVAFTLNSTVFTRDTHLHNLFAHGERLLLEPRTPGSPVPTTSPPPDTETCKILKAAHAIQLSAVVQFLPTILNHVFRMLVRVSSASQDLSINIIRLLVHLVYSLHDAGRTDTLSTYAKFVFVGDIEGSTVHEQLCAHLPALLRPNNTDFLLVNKFLPHSGFFFQIIVKSMAQYLLTTGRIKMLRNERFPQSYLTNVESLLNVLSPYLTSKHKDMPQEVQQLNASIAFFLKKCLSLMDRGFVFRLINSHLAHFGSDSESRAIQELKFTFLQIVSSHEHFVSFNLPVWLSKSRQDLSSEYSLSEEYCRQHFLTGLVLNEVRAALHQVLAIRRTGVLTLRDVMAKHELDDRYQNKGQLSRIAMLYLPWLGIAIDNLPRLTAGVNANYKLNPLSHVNGSEVSLASSSPQRLKSQESVNGTLSNRSSLVIKDAAFFAAAIAGQGLLNGASSTVSLDSESLILSSDNNSSISQETAIQREENSSCAPNTNRHSRSVSGTQVVRCDKLLSSEVKDILMCFLFLVKHLAQDQLIAWWSHCPATHVLSFFKLIELCLYEFKYTGKRHIGRGVSSAAPPASISVSKAMTLPARMQPPDFSSEPTHVLLSGTNSVGRDNSAHLRGSESNMSHFHQALLEANLATEVGLICLDCLGLYSVHFKDTLLSSGGDNATMRSVLELYLCFLHLGQSETLFRHVFASLRAFINHFSLALFQGNAVLCGRLCLELLRCCNSRLSAIRQESCAILYLLMRSNFEFSNRRGLTRVHLQVIISVSQLLGNIVGLNNARFQESLSLINSYATSDKVMKGTGFPIEVKDLTKRIRTVLMATAQMKELHHDPEVLSDLHHSLANSYASTPELRFTWLETMTRNHVKDLNFSEAACCQLHIAALMAQYLKLKGVQSWGAEAFDKISSNIPRDETGLKLDSGVHEVHYTEQSLLDQLESCASYLEQSERYELLPSLYRLILPLYEARRDYEAQARCYQALTQACYQVVTVVRSGKRLLGRFYRVAFFGQEYFEEEHGVEFVYKEPKVTSLSEISERLLHQYTNKFGANTVKIIMDSAPINANDLDPKIAHIQVTSVTPHFDKLDLESARVSEFEQNHDVATFMFETPFTKDGSNKPRAEPCDQWKRRTVISTEYAFPYVKKRLKVVAKREMELSPIEVALDEMTQRVAELADVVFTKPTDAKKLQLRLQGSVCVQVNAGPLAYATAFLDPAQERDREYSDEKIEELKDVFREFVRVCYAALQLNSQVVRSDQVEYQAALRTNFHKLCTDLSALFQETLWPDTELGSFKRNSQALFSAISGANSNSSSA